MVTVTILWSAEAIETALAAQGIALASGRAERIARAQQALLEAAAADPLRAALTFDANPAGYLAALESCR